MIAESMSGANTADRPLPASLAAYMATSACRSSSAPSCCPAAPVAIPMLALIRTSRAGAVPVGRERLGQGGQHPVGSRLGLAEVGGVLDQDGELVAAEPSDGVARAQHATQALGDGDQQLVAGSVTGAVVDGLEVVEVDEQRGHRGRPAVGAGEGVPERGR